MSENKNGVQPPPPILHIGREEIKPGKSFAHEKIETAWTQALVKARYTQSFLAAESITGPSEVLWFYGYPTMEAFETDYKMENSTPAMQTIAMQYGPSEADVVAGTGDTLSRYREDLSYGAPINIGEYHYVSITTYRVRPGHNNDFAELMKTANEARKNGNSTTHIAVYQVTSGAPSGTFLVITPRKSLAEIGQMNPAMTQAMNDVENKLTELTEKAVNSSSNAIYAFNARMSKPTEEQAKADPAFWKPKMTMAKAAPSETPGAKSTAAKQNKP
ncbi:MAG: hypothetical protein JO041_08075 [Acidobacteria bacterium]|nr:hypothetical protein [Acidobacteriota bacterium]